MATDKKLEEAMAAAKLAQEEKLELQKKFDEQTENAKAIEAESKKKSEEIEALLKEKTELEGKLSTSSNDTIATSDADLWWTKDELVRQMMEKAVSLKKDCTSNIESPETIAKLDVADTIENAAVKLNGLL